jgi:hypothetical protein
MIATLACRLCGGESRLSFEREVLGRHACGYYRCAACGLTQTSAPAWLEEAYASAIHPTDTGILARNLGVRRVAATFLELAGARDRPCLDYAAGYGIFVRLMRDVGFSFYGWDPYAQNLLAPGWEWHAGLGSPFACTAFEVLEHFVHPVEEFRKLTAFEPEWILTSTELAPEGGPPSDWHYLSVESGQHVSFYQARTLARLGKECGYAHVIAGPYHQVFGRRPVSRLRWQLATRLAPLLFTWVRKRRHSFTVDDCEAMRRALRAGSANPHDAKQPAADPERTR